MQHRLNTLRRQAGITIVECTVTTAVLAVLTSQVVPGLSATAEKQRLEGVAAQLRTDVQYTRSQAIALNRTLRISFDATAGAGCYVVHSGEANQCSCNADGTAAVCTGGAQPLRSVRLEPAQRVSLSTNVRSMLFDPTKGTATPTATLKVQAKSGAAIHQVVNIMGRVRTCSPGGTAGHPAC